MEMLGYVVQVEEDEYATLLNDDIGRTSKPNILDRLTAQRAHDYFESRGYDAYILTIWSKKHMRIEFKE